MLKVLFDTSVLLAALVADHTNHTASLAWLLGIKAKEVEGFVSTHTLAELYAVLTHLPLAKQITPELAQRLLVENLEGFQKVVLTAEDHQTALVTVVKLNRTGSSIYDGLTAQAALKAEVDVLLTLNPKHFTTMGKNVAQLVQEPK